LLEEPKGVKPSLAKANYTFRGYEEKPRCFISKFFWVFESLRNIT